MLKISKALYNQIVTHCRSRYPKEACGILAGSEGNVAQVYTMRNVEDSPIGYSMDPKEQLLVEKQMRSKSQRMIGVYHSHTATEAYPSPVDVSRAISPDISYVLVSLKSDVVRFKKLPAVVRWLVGWYFRPRLCSYRIDGTTVTEEPVQIDGA